jgi:hypothetical protein
MTVNETTDTKAPGQDGQLSTSYWVATQFPFFSPSTALFFFFLF